jgi:diguanylate cyclase (GGDEF)-like protein/PAS domain S-box-containing protein
VSEILANGAWRLMVESLPDGAVLVDASVPDLPVVYANPAFERLTGFSRSELLGCNLRMLQGEERHQAGRQRLRDAIEAGVETRALVHNFRKDGEPFWMEVHLVPVRDAAGQLTHWLSLHRESEARGTQEDRSTGRFQAMAPMLLQRDDPLTGLKSRATFEDLLAHHHGLARREGRAMTLLAADVDDLGGYNETFGRTAGDALLKRVARAIGTCFRRGSDVLCRWEGGSFVALASGMDEAQMREHGERVCARVRDMRIHHPHSRYGRHVTISAGLAGGVPARDAGVDSFREAAFAALAEARARGDSAVLRLLPGDPAETIDPESP